jgi:hypothetical protein
MFQIGPSLREARTRRGLSPADVHKGVRIRERYLTALEEERWELLPGDAYTKGFLRTYAEFLGLNGQLYVDEYNARIATHDEEPLVPETLGGRRRGGLLFRTIGAVLLVAALVAGFTAWRHAGAPARPTLDSAAAAAPNSKAKPQTKPVVAPLPSFAVVRAVRDRSWLSIRVGGPAGREVYRGTLLPGHVLKLGLQHPLWVRMGRPRALDIRIGTRVVDNLPAAPANITLTR